MRWLRRSPSVSSECRSQPEPPGHLACDASGCQANNSLKARRGAPAVPLERALRDARAFRIAGGVDFLIDYYAVKNGLLPMYDEGPAEPAATPPDDPRLSRRNAAHLTLIAGEVLELGRTCRELRLRCPELTELHRRQRTLVLLGQIAHELFAMTTALARAASLADDASQALADVYCATARHRVRSWTLELAAEPDPGLADSITACVDPPSSDQWRER